MRFRTSITTAAVLSALCATAHSADLPRNAPLLPPPPPLPGEASGFLDGFYLRIDGGVGFNSRPRLSTLPDPVGAPTGSFVDPNYGGIFTSSTYTASRLSDSAFGGLGLGYRFTPWLRFDVTGEYRGGSKLTATNVLNDVGTTAGPFGRVASSNSALSNFSGQLSSAVFLANGYVDLGQYWGFTPFVGGGVGVASNRLARLSDTGVITTQVAGAPPFSFPTTAFLPARSRTELAWALMAGVSYDITPNLKVEAGYRYLNLGGFQSGQENFVFPNAVVTVPFYGRGRDFVSNDIKVGLRWSFSSAAAADLPLTRRY